jgi:hypothetical protein
MSRSKIATAPLDKSLQMWTGRLLQAMGLAAGSDTRLGRDHEKLGELVRDHGQGGFDVAAAYADHLRSMVLANLPAVVEQLTSGSHWEVCWNCDEHRSAELGLCTECAEEVRLALR